MPTRIASGAAALHFDACAPNAYAFRETDRFTRGQTVGSSTSTPEARRAADVERSSKTSSASTASATLTPDRGSPLAAASDRDVENAGSSGSTRIASARNSASGSYLRASTSFGGETSARFC